MIFLIRRVSQFWDKKIKRIINWNEGVLVYAFGISSFLWNKSISKCFKKTFSQSLIFNKIISNNFHEEDFKGEET